MSDSPETPATSPSQGDGVGSATTDSEGSRKWVKRGIIGFLVAANVTVFGFLAVLWLGAKSVTASVSTIPASELDLADRPATLSEPRTFLLIGSDSRENLPEELGSFGSFGGQRADVIMLLQVLPEDREIQLLSIPRDTKVVADGSAMKINSAFGGGPASIVSAVSEFAEVPIHHYLQVNFAGFASIVDAVGGIEMTFPYPARDLKSHFEVGAGTRTLDGPQALALARSRSYQELQDGQWVSVAASDIGRTERQQDLLLAILTQLDRPSSISGFQDLLRALSDFVTIDDALDEDTIIQLAWEMRSLGAGGMDTRTLPVKDFYENGVAYVVPRQPLADAVLAAFRDGAPLTNTDNLDIKVAVQNGNGRAGSASLIGDLLLFDGWEVVATENAERSDFARTLVVTRPNLLFEAEKIVADLGFGVATVGRTPKGADVVVIVGLDAPAN